MPVAHHAFGGQLGQHHARHQVGVDQRADFGGRHGLQGLAVASPHVVDQHVEPPEFGIDAGEGGLDGGVVGNVERQRRSGQAVGAQRLHGLADGLHVAAVDQDVRATARHGARDAQAQPAGRTGDQRDLAGQRKLLQER